MDSDDIIKTDTFNLSAARHPGGFFRNTNTAATAATAVTAVTAVTPSPAAQTDTFSLDADPGVPPLNPTSSTSSDRIVSWNSTVAEQNEAEQKHIAARDKTRKLKETLNNEFEDFFGQSLDPTCAFDSDTDEEDHLPTTSKRTLTHSDSTAAIGVGRANPTPTPWYSRSGFIKNPEPAAMTNHALTLRSAGVNNNSHRRSVEGSLRDLNQISKGFRDVNEVFPDFRKMNSHLKKQLHKQGVRILPLQAPPSSLLTTATRSYSVRGESWGAAASHQPSIDSTIVYNNPTLLLPVKPAALLGGANVTQTETAQGTTIPSFPPRLSFLSSSDSDISNSSPAPYPTVTIAKQPSKPKIPRVRPAAPPPPPSLPPPSTTRPSRTPSHAVAMTLAFLDNATLHLKPGDLPPGDSYTNKTTTERRMTASKQMFSTRPTAASIPHPPLAKQPKDELLRQKLNIDDNIAQQRTLGRLPSRVPSPPPPDPVDLLLATHSDRPSQAKIVVTDEFRLSGGTDKMSIASSRVSSGSDYETGDGGRVRTPSVVQQGLAPPAPPPPVGEEGEEGESEGRGSVVAKGLAPAAPPPPPFSAIPAGNRSGRMSRRMESFKEEKEEQGEPDDDVDPHLDSIHEVSGDVHMRIRTLSKAMGEQVKSELKKQGMKKEQVNALFQRKNHSRFSLLRISTGTVDDEGADSGEELDIGSSSSDGEDVAGDEEEGEEEEDEEEEGDDVFMSTFMYMQENMAPHNVDSYLERTRTISAVQKPRALSKIEGSDEILERLEREKEEARAGRESAASGMEEFLGAGAPAGGVRVRERDLNDAQFREVYEMTRDEFKKLNMVRRAYLRNANLDKRPFAT